MLNTKKLLNMARKWRREAAFGRRRIMSARNKGSAESDNFSARIANRGHLFVYSLDGKRFMIPISYLMTNIFRELFRMSEEELGMPSDGPIILPCDASSMERIISLLQFQVSTDVERAVLTHIARSRCSVNSLQPLGNNQQNLILCGF